MPDWNAFHLQVRSLQESTNNGPNRYKVAVHLLDRLPQSQLDKSDFQVMLANSKTTIQKIRDTYKKHFNETDIELSFENEMPPSDARIQDLDHYQDGLVVLRAVRQHAFGHIQAPSRITSRAAGYLQADHVPATPQSEPPAPELSASAIPNTTDHTTPFLFPQVPVPTNIDMVATSKAMLRELQESYDKRAVRHSSHALSMFNVHTSILPLSEPLRSSSSNPQLPTKVAHGMHTGTSSYSDQRVATLSSSDHDAYFHPSKIKPEMQSPSRLEIPVPDIEHSSAEVDFSMDDDKDSVSQIGFHSTDSFIRATIDHPNVETLEAGMTKAMEVLINLRSTFSRYVANNPDVSTCIEAIAKIIKHPELNRTVMGVVGNTGAGKSSVINAMLDEERLVPTNCMRACTAVVTELSWNISQEAKSKYRAEIEFISGTDWQMELTILMTEFLTENGTIAKDASDQNSDAGIAWAKFHAVYPTIQKEELRKWTVEELMAERSVVAVLDTTKRIESATPQRFYSELQKFVDSKEKATTKKEKGKSKQNLQMEYWPLIKVVKIYTKSAALATGAVIVDLPGVHDSNAARAAVAERYMKQCTGLWIVAPITRAVDDKVAKSLLGDSFKRQLKYDGNYSSVTFICSKTDDISITEAIDSLGLEDHISIQEDQQKAHESVIKDLITQIDNLQNSVEVYKKVIDGTEKDIETWEDLKDLSEDGKRVWAPRSIVPGKRKSGGSGHKSRKQRQSENEDIDSDCLASDIDDVDSSGDDSDADIVQMRARELTHEEIKHKLEELKGRKKHARQEKAILIEQIVTLKPQIRELKGRVVEVRAEISAICITGRNEYSKGAIQRDFAAGIKELDQENAAEENEEQFNPDIEIRDYDEVARSLPVFCVSSRAYQKMRGRLNKDENIAGFKTPEATEMPQLQAHCRKLTEPGRIQACRTFLLGFCQQLTAFSLWASNDSKALELTDGDKRKQVEYLQARLAELNDDLEEAVIECTRRMKKELSDQILNRYPEAIDEAVNAAPNTASKWGFRDEGGLYYQSYKAVCRRRGKLQSKAAGHRDFNADLVDPITKKLATGWERAFQNRLPKALESYTKASRKVLQHFREKFEEHAYQDGVGLARISMLKGAICNYEQMFQNLGVELEDAMAEAQKDANRDFVPTIATTMRVAYKTCTGESGAGSFMRMKDHMTGYVNLVRHEMFEKATETVESHLDDMCRKLEKKMGNKADEIFGLVRADYMRVFGGVDVSRDDLSQDEKNMRAEVKHQLLGIDSQFESIATGVAKDEAYANTQEEEMDIDAEVDQPLQYDEPVDSTEKYHDDTE